MDRKRIKIVKNISWILLLATMFLAGFTAGSGRSFRNGFETGYEAASKNISSRIRAGMNDLQPFYISDIGFRFSPRGTTIATVRFIGDEAVYSAKGEAAK